MALTVRRFIGPIPPQEFLSIVQVTLDNAYPAGGYALAPAMFNFSAFAAVPSGASRSVTPILLSGSGQAGFAFEMDVDQTTGTLRVYYPTGGSPASPGAIGDPVGATGAVAVTSSAATLPIVPGRGKEVAAGTDLSTLSAILLGIGH